METALLISLIVVVMVLARNRRMHEKADMVVRRYCERNGLQFLDGTVAFKGMRLDRRRFHFCRSYRFDYSLNSADRFQGMLTLCGEHIQSFRVNPDHLTATTVE